MASIMVDSLFLYTKNDLARTVVRVFSLCFVPLRSTIFEFSPNRPCNKPPKEIAESQRRSHCVLSVCSPTTDLCESWLIKIGSLAGISQRRCFIIALWPSIGLLKIAIWNCGAMWIENQKKLEAKKWQNQIWIDNGISGMVFSPSRIALDANAKCFRSPAKPLAGFGDERAYKYRCGFAAKSAESICVCWYFVAA